jgi:hypothetical protein
MKDPDFVVYAHRRLYINFYPDRSPCRGCGESIDGKGEHANKCKRVGKNTPHASLNHRFASLVAKKIRSSGASAAITTEKNMQNYLKPGVVMAGPPRMDTVVNVIGGRMYYVDYTLVSHNASASSTISTVDIAENKKVAEFTDRYNMPTDGVFLPAAIDSYGRWGKGTHKLVNSVARMVASGSSTASYGREVSELRVALSAIHAIHVTRQIVNYLMWAGTRVNWRAGMVTGR